MRPSDFDPEQLRIGTRVEMEHTTDPRIAMRIAMDHLAEDPDYYKKLAKIHLDRARRVTLGAARCSQWSRGARGSVGFLVGVLITNALVGPVAYLTAPTDREALRRRTWIVFGLSLLGGVGGAAIAARKPTC
jgi:hypothetical protein